MKKIIVAVSGGVDSVVLLDILAKLSRSGKLNRELIVAHFEHGIREDSVLDLELVRNLAENHGLKFEFKHGKLGENSSEEKARTARYNFLREISKKYDDAKIATAHHKNDLAETVLINLERGTGWRGLAVLDSEDIWRPLLGRTKSEILDYAKKHELSWHEDSTNSSDKYLRNRLRKKLENSSDENLNSVLNLWQKQIGLKSEIDEEVDEKILEIIKNKDGKMYFSRYFFSQIESEIAIEILRKIVMNQTGKTLTRPQLLNFWLNIKTVQMGKKIQLSGKNTIKFTKTEFFFE